jgi:hypothetical protein
MTTKIYHGVRVGVGNTEVTVSEEGMVSPLEQVVYHSPTGMEWGYGGSGPSDLALSILADFFNEQPLTEGRMNAKTRTVQLYQRFKEQFVAHFGSSWTLGGKAIADWVAKELYENNGNG